MNKTEDWDTKYNWFVSKLIAVIRAQAENG